MACLYNVCTPSSCTVAGRQSHSLICVSVYRLLPHLLDQPGRHPSVGADGGDDSLHHQEGSLLHHWNTGEQHCGCGLEKRPPTHLLQCGMPAADAKTLGSPWPINAASALPSSRPALKQNLPHQVLQTSVILHQGCAGSCCAQHYPFPAALLCKFSGCFLCMLLFCTSLLTEPRVLQKPLSVSGAGRQSPYALAFPNQSCPQASTALIHSQSWAAETPGTLPAHAAAHSPLCGLLLRARQ